jgi:hypothetical protein
MTARHFIDRIGAFQLPQLGPREICGPFQVHKIDLRRLKLGLGAFTPFVTLDVPRDSVDLRQALLTFSREVARDSPTVYLAEPDDDYAWVDPAMLVQHAIAVLTHVTRTECIEAREAEKCYRALGSALATSIGASALSPYSPGRPASGGRFFGRSKVLNEIVSGKTVRNCTIVGNRRIGKTSLLHEVREQLSDVYMPGKTIHFAEIYANKAQSTWDMVYLILSQLGVQVPSHWAKFGAIAPRYVNRFPQLLHDFAKRNQTKVVILIDEFDSFLEHDAQQRWEFLHLLREAGAEDGPCSVIIAGFRLLMLMRVRQDNPYHNFTREIALTPLTKEETLEMVTTPLARLGIDLSRSNIPGVIHRETRGHPEMVQMYCQAIIALHARRHALPSDAELLQHVTGEAAFTRTILHTFLNNANHFEQILCLTLMQRAVAGRQSVAEFEFRIADAERALDGVNQSLTTAEMATVLNNLVVGSFIERVAGAPGQYRFAIPQLVRFCQAVDLNELLSNALARLADTRPSIDTLVEDIGGAVT